MANEADDEQNCDEHEANQDAHDTARADSEKPAQPKEIGGRGGPDPTRFGDWEKNGRCIDF